MVQALLAYLELKKNIYHAPFQKIWGDAVTTLILGWFYRENTFYKTP